MRPYVIPVLPYGLQKSAGIRATYRLAHELNALGAPAFVDVNWHVARHPGELAVPDDLEAPQLQGAPDHVRCGAYDAGIVVAVDNAHVDDHPRVVRWHLGEPQPRNVTPHGDYVWNPGWGHGTMTRLWLGSIYEAEIFRPPPAGAPRRGTAVWVGKGRFDEEAAVVPDDALLISYGWPEARADLARLFQSLDLLISFDDLTSLALEALLCGTPVLFAGDARRTRRAAFGYPTLPGTAWSEAELPAARASVAGAFDAFVAARREAEGDVARFLEETQARFSA